MSGSPNLLVARDEHILTITLNRPEVHNALSLATLLEFREALATAREDQNIRAVILAAAGEGAFSAGADLKERATMDDDGVRRFIENVRELGNDLESHPVPILAAISGHAFGGGTELALACDLRIAAENAQLGLTECRLAIIPGGGGTQRLPRLVGPGWAREMIFRGRRVGAEEAYQIGLVCEVTPAGLCLERTREIALEIAACGPVAIRAAKRAINQGLQVSLAEGLAIETECYETTIPTHDRTEALTAFREKRPPRFEGR